MGPNLAVRKEESRNQLKNTKMAEVIRMPKMSDTMTEGVIAKWNKNVGDKVKSGDILAEVETDKATMDLDNYFDGVLLHIGPKEGESVPIDSIIAIIGKQGEDIQSLLSGGSGGEKPNNVVAEEAPKVEVKVESNSAPKAQVEDKQAGSESKEAHDERIKASPLAKAIAKEKGIDLHDVEGSGDGGRIVKRDLDRAAETTAPQAQPQAESQTKAAPAPIRVSVDSAVATDHPVSQMRKVIARRLAESKFGAPHFYLTIDIDMDRAMAVRKQLNEGAEIKLSFNDFVVKACASALRKHPAINSSWLGDVIRENHEINIGVAVAVEDGLLVPVIHQADRKSMSEISVLVKELAKKAHDKKLQPTEWEGNTFTISNLGMMGIEEFTAIINPPDACILAVGAIRQEPVVKDGLIVVGNRMKVTLSCDHRVVDGATGASFLATFKGMLEEPLKMLA